MPNLTPAEANTLLRGVAHMPQGASKTRDLNEALKMWNDSRKEVLQE